MNIQFSNIVGICLQETVSSVRHQANTCSLDRIKNPQTAARLMCRNAETAFSQLLLLKVNELSVNIQMKDHLVQNAIHDRKVLSAFVQLQEHITDIFNQRITLEQTHPLLPLPINSH